MKASQRHRYKLCSSAANKRINTVYYLESPNKYCQSLNGLNSLEVFCTDVTRVVKEIERQG